MGWKFCRRPIEVRFLLESKDSNGRVELFGLTGALPTPLGDVPVGIDPVSLRFLTTNEFGCSTTFHAPSILSMWLAGSELNVRAFRTCWLGFRSFHKAHTVLSARHSLRALV